MHVSKNCDLTVGGALAVGAYRHRDVHLVPFVATLHKIQQPIHSYRLYPQHPCHDYTPTKFASFEYRMAQKILYEIKFYGLMTAQILSFDSVKF